MLKNIHVNINHIHIRYEDENSSIGIHIDSICIKNSETAAENETEAAESAETPQKSKNFARKACEVNDFCIYTDTRTIYKEDVTKEEVFEKMSFEKISGSDSLKHIIKPTSLIAQVYRDMSLQPLRKRNRPRINVSSILKEFHLHIDVEQVAYISNILKLVNIHRNTHQVTKPTSLSESKKFEIFYSAGFLTVPFFRQRSLNIVI